jgi:hypothetical protein
LRWRGELRPFAEGLAHGLSGSARHVVG